MIREVASRGRTEAARKLEVIRQSKCKRVIIWGVRPAYFASLQSSPGKYTAHTDPILNRRRDDLFVECWREQIAQRLRHEILVISNRSLTREDRRSKAGNDNDDG